MKYMPVTLPYHACALCLCAALTIITCGCTRQQATSSQTSSGAVTVTRPVYSHISVAFVGAPGMDTP